MRYLRLFSSCIWMLLVLSASTAANAQTFPAPLKNPVYDEHGVELRTGRYGGLSVPIISIGGDGDASLTRIYAPQDGREMIVQAVAERHSEIVNLSISPNHLDQYDVVTIYYSGGSDSFRRKTGTTNQWTPEYATGATLVEGGTWDAWTFTNKYGLVITNSKVTFPDGREILGGIKYSSGADPVFADGGDISNNFGFRLRATVQNGETLTQAINMTEDYCNSNLTAACANLKQSRSASVKRPSRSQIFLKNPEGEETQVLLQSIEAYDIEPTCIQNYGQPCQWLGTRWSYYYPQKVTRPGYSVPDETITYDLSGQASNFTHNKILVKSIARDGLTIDYTNSYSPTGSFGGQNGSQVVVSPYIDGKVELKANASVATGVPWPRANVKLDSIADGLLRPTNFTYNTRGDVTRVTYPEGNSVEYTYDNRFNVTQVILHPKPGQNSLDSITTYMYVSTCSALTQNYCNLPTSMIDSRGGRTDYTYNSRGQVLTIVGPAPTAGSARPITRNNYSLRTAQIRAESGGAVAAGSPISLLASTSVCISMSSCEGTMDEVITEYDYGPESGPNNLLLRGRVIKAVSSSGNVVTRRICYGYNYFGERISETLPRSDLASCP